MSLSLNTILIVIYYLNFFRSRTRSKAGYFLINEFILTLILIKRLLTKSLIPLTFLTL